MSGGYTPLFQTVLEGTLFGKWPHTGIWTCLLSQCDKHGHIDQHPALLAAKIGVPVDLLLQCIADFMAPDPASRTGDMDGRRLELIDPASREWGWKVINHSLYREKARKQVYDRERTESGRDAQRKQENRGPAKSRVVPTRPAKSRSQTHTADSDKEESDKRAARIPADFVLTPERRLVAEAETLPAERTFAKFCDYWRAKSGAAARKVDWDATWRVWCMTEKDRGYSNGKASEPSRQHRKFGT